MGVACWVMLFRCFFDRWFRKATCFRCTSDDLARERNQRSRASVRECTTPAVNHSISHLFSHTYMETTFAGSNSYHIQRSTLQFYDSSVASRVAASMKRQRGVVDLRGKPRVLVLKPHIFPGSGQPCYKVCNNPFFQRSVVGLEVRSGQDKVMGVGKTWCWLGEGYLILRGDTSVGD
jgi:hypothetical protein